MDGETIEILRRGQTTPAKAGVLLSTGAANLQPGVLVSITSLTGSGDSPQSPSRIIDAHAAL